MYFWCFLLKPMFTNISMRKEHSLQKIPRELIDKFTNLTDLKLFLEVFDGCFCTFAFLSFALCPIRDLIQIQQSVLAHRDIQMTLTGVDQGDVCHQL